MKIFKVYIDDGKDCYKEIIPANTLKDVKNYVKGNGEVISVKDITNERTPFNLEILSQNLLKSGYSHYDVDIITRCLSNCNLGE